MAAEIGLERDVKELDVNPAHVAAHPFLEDIDEEAAVLLGADRALRAEVAGLRIERTLAAGPFAPALVGDFKRFRGRTLDDWDELHPFGIELVAKKAIDGAAVFLVGGVDRAENVEFDSVSAQVPPPLHDPVEGALSAAVDPVGVVKLTRTIDAQPDQDVVALEEGAPLIIEKHAVGLEGM